MADSGEFPATARWWPREEFGQIEEINNSLVLSSLHNLHFFAEGHNPYSNQFSLLTGGHIQILLRGDYRFYGHSLICDPWLTFRQPDSKEMVNHVILQELKVKEGLYIIYVCSRCYTAPDFIFEATKYINDIDI
ncbi:hypothetical protein ABFS82_05G083500 [Erythranthe guttata]